MRLKLMVLQIAATLVMGCSLFEDEVEWLRMAAPVDSVAIPDTVSLGERITFRMVFQLNDSCWKFSHLEVVHTDFDIWVRGHAKRDPGLLCFPVLLSFDTTASFLPVSTGDYQFHFWQSDSSSLDTIVVVRPFHRKTQTPAKGRM